MTIFRRKSAEQELKGAGQRMKGKVQEVAGRATGEPDLRARGEVNQAAGRARGAAGEAGRKISGALEPKGPRRRGTR